jgi:hypothetical protein
MEFRLSRSLFTNFSLTRRNSGYQGAFSRTFLSHDGIMAIREPFHELFFHRMEFRLSRSLFMNVSLTRWNLGYQGAFHELLFFTMESWLSRSLSRTSLFHDGILTIKEPFTNFSFSRWNLGYQGAFSRITVEFWLSRSLFTNHGGILAIKEPFNMIKFTKCMN